MGRDWLATSFLIFLAFNLVFWWGYGAEGDEDLGAVYWVVVVFYLVVFIAGMVKRSFFS